MRPSVTFRQVVDHLGAGTSPATVAEASGGLSGGRRTLNLHAHRLVSWSTPLSWFASAPPPDGLSLATLGRIAGLMRPHRRRVAVAFALGLGMLLVTTLLPLVTRTII